MNNKIKIIGGIAVLVIIFGLAWFFVKHPTQQQVSKLDTIDTVTDFYGQWLKAAQSTDTDPYKAGLAKSPILSKELRAKLASAKKDSSSTLDPVLCQTVTPEAISTRSVSELADKAQVLVTSRDKKVTEQANVTLIRFNDGWYIGDITCSPGEFEPEREFSFEKEGYLLKGSIPAPYDPKNWHLVFEENGQPGHVVPLFFDSKSQCTSLDGTSSVCKPDQFTEATKVSVHGQMTERGLTVNKQEFIK